MTDLPVCHPAPDGTLAVMPEIRNEVPSEDELREYFDLCLARTTLPWLRPPTKALHNPYPDEMVAALAFLRPLGADRFYELATAALFRSLLRLNHLPRTDPFWHNTNKRPTWFKLTEFCYRLLRANPDDELALWTLGALEVGQSGDTFGQASWTPLHAQGRFELPWAVCAAYLTSGAAPDTADQLASFLLEQSSLNTARAVLEPFRRQAAGDLPGWIAEVERQLDTLGEPDA